jgi:2-polyprenyl-3-methyl-5-hydroxy-6-metoxy-1,4-benzoquinol methylase
MNFVVDVTREKQKYIQAVTHNDGTSRIQSVTKDQNEFLYEIISEFYKSTNVPMLVNTSFNLSGEPIVCTPEDAIGCYERSEIDLLIIEDYFIEHKRNSQCNKPHSMKSLNEFYYDSPFNNYLTTIDAALNLSKKNQIKNYPYLHNFLKQHQQININIIDIGCGTGWFTNTISHYYQIPGLGIDANPKAIHQANGIKRYLANSNKNIFQTCDLFQLPNEQKFKLVNSMGVLHHVQNFDEALIKIASLADNGGYLHLGLYHKHHQLCFPI